MAGLKGIWPFGSKSAEPEKAKTEKLVRVSQLPIYPEGEKLSDFQFVPDPPLPMQQSLSGFRQLVQRNYDRFMNTYGSARQFVDNTSNSAMRVNTYVREEGTVIPKAIAITLGGMAGFLFGMQRGGSAVRGLYSGLGMATMAAFCYPHETVDVSRSACKTVSEQWTNFKKSPTPLPPVEKDLSLDPAGVKEMKASQDIDMYSTRSTRI